MITWALRVHHEMASMSMHLHVMYGHSVSMGVLRPLRVGLLDTMWDNLGFKIFTGIVLVLQLCRDASYMTCSDVVLRAREGSATEPFDQMGAT